MELDRLSATPQSADMGADPEQSGPSPVIVYMSGRLRGTVEPLTDSTVLIVREGQSGVRVRAPEETADGDVPVRLHRAGESYELEVMPEESVWVNAERTENSRLLESGDVLEIGRNGPMLRYRLYADGVVPKRSVAEAFADCFDVARYDHRDVVRRTGRLLGEMTSELVVRTTLWFRVGVMILLAALVASTAYLIYENRQLAERVARSEAQMAGMSVILQQTQSKAITEEDLLALRSSLEVGLSTAVERVGALEARFGASARIISAASRSVLFLQGAYGFVDQESGKPLRYVAVGPDGTPFGAPLGGPAVTLDGDGPLVEVQFTGTAFIASGNGLLLTNRHVAMPWEEEESDAVAEMGLQPVIQRFIGYLPGVTQSFEVSLVSASEDSDLAILRCTELTGEIKPLTLSTVPPQPGDVVIVLGYPTGIRAMLARTDENLLDDLRARDDLDFWTVVAHLAKSGHITPIATSGIVGQVTESAIVYDAETTHGGSGGPVINLDGEVIAVNAAILPEFGGSNIGVPVARTRALLEGVN
ncbi:MAG: serine protease [Gammaproteobacteria bacterium]|nr:serine protease [Gammaproteobacteria bacterium]